MINRAAIENKLRIAKMHLADALEKKSGKQKSIGGEDYVIELTNRMINDFKKQLADEER